MKPSYVSALLIGAVVGLVLALALTLYVGATGATPSMDAMVEGGSVIPVFSPPASSLWVMVVLAAGFGGLVAAVATKAAARVIDPDARSASLWVIAPLGIVVAAVIGMAVFPLGAIVFGTIEEGAVTLGVMQFVALAVTTGLVAGALVVWQSYILARPPQTAQDTSIRMDTADQSA